MCQMYKIIRNKYVFGYFLNPFIFFSLRSLLLLVDALPLSLKNLLLIFGPAMFFNVANFYVIVWNLAIDF